MGERLARKYRQLNKADKLAFFGTFVLGLLVHIYKFVNYLPNHDSLDNIFFSQNISGSGRWLLSAACALSSYLDLPWITGLFSLFWLSLTAVLIVRLFAVKNPIPILLMGGLLVTFPGITEIFFFQYTADGYMLGLCLSALAAYVLTPERQSPKRVAIAALLITGSCAIYQVFVSVSLMLSIGYLLFRLPDGKTSAKQNWLWVGKQAVAYTAGLGLYYGIWKGYMRLSGTILNAYNGIDQIGFAGIGGLFVAAKRAVLQFVDFFRKGFAGLLNGNCTFPLYYYLITLSAVALVVMGIVVTVRRKLWQRKGDFVLMLCALVAVPFATHIWFFSSPGMSYIGQRMELGMVVLFLLAVAVFDKYAKPLVSDGMALLLAAVVLVNAVGANVSYFYMNRTWECSLATATELSARLHALDDGTIQKVAIVGTSTKMYDQGFYENGLRYGVSPVGPGNLNYTDQKIVEILGEVLHFELQYYADHPDAEIPVYPKGLVTPADGNQFRFPAASDEEIAALSQSPEVRQMRSWPSADSVQVMGHTVVIKLSDIVMEK